MAFTASPSSATLAATGRGNFGPVATGAYQAMPAGDLVVMLNALPPVPAVSTLPQVADGNGFDTEVLLINTGLTDANYSLQFFDPSGAPVTYGLDPTQSGMTGMIHADRKRSSGPPEVDRPRTRAGAD